MQGRYLWADGQLDILPGFGKTHHVEMLRRMIQEGRISPRPTNWLGGDFSIDEFHGLPPRVTVVWDEGQHPTPEEIGQMILIELENYGREQRYRESVRRMAGTYEEGGSSYYKWIFLPDKQFLFGPAFLWWEETEPGPKGEYLHHGDVLESYGVSWKDNWIGGTAGVWKNAIDEWVPEVHGYTKSKDSSKLEEGRQLAYDKLRELHPEVNWNYYDQYAPGGKFAATSEDTEAVGENVGFLAEPHSELYPPLFKGEKTIPQDVKNKLKAHVLDVLEEDFEDPDNFIYFTIYGSGVSYNWDEGGDLDIQMWIDLERFQILNEKSATMTMDDLLAAVRRRVQTVNFPSFKDLGLMTPNGGNDEVRANGSMLIQYYPKPGKGTREENVASQPYACYDLEENDWIVEPDPITPTFYGQHFVDLMPKAEDMAIQAEALISEFERNVLNWQFWFSLYSRYRNPVYYDQYKQAMDDATMEKEGIKNLFDSIFKGRQEAYAPEGKGINDERDMVQKLLEVWGIFQKLKHYARSPLPWEEQELPAAPVLESDSDGSEVRKSEGSSRYEVNSHVDVSPSELVVTRYSISQDANFVKSDIYYGSERADLQDFRTDQPGWKESMPLKAKQPFVTSNGVKIFGLRFTASGDVWEDFDLNHRSYLYNPGTKTVYYGFNAHHNELIKAFGLWDVWEEDFWLFGNGMATYGREWYDSNLNLIEEPKEITLALREFKPLKHIAQSPEHDDPGGWPGIMEKAQRLRNNGQVQVVRNSPTNVVGIVQGDHGTYNTEIWRDDPQRGTITLWNCFLPDAPVTMADGTRKRIQEITIGDEVITHKGNVKRVTAVMTQPYNGNITRIKLSGQDEEVVATSNHPVWTADQNLHLERVSGTSRWRQTGSTQVRDKITTWKEIGQLKRGDYLSYTLNVEEQPLSLTYSGQVGQRKDASTGRFVHEATTQRWEVDVALAYLLGWYIAEGCQIKSARNRVAFTLSLNEIDVAHILSRICEEKFGTPGTIRIIPERNVIDFRVSHYGLRQMVEELAPGDARTKVLDERILSLPLEILRELMRGWIEGDGNLEETGNGQRINLVTVSENLAHQARLILTRLGYAASLMWTDENNGDGFVSNWCRLYRLRWHTNRDYHTAQRMHDGKSAWLRVDSVTTEFYKGQVYDIEVEDDHSFQAYGVGVHNCDCPWSDYSWGRTRQWKRYEGRPCAHTLALYWEALTRPLEPEEGQPEQLQLPGEQWNLPDAIRQTLPNQQPQPTPSILKTPEEVGQLELPGTFSRWHRTTAFENGDYVKTNEPVEGYDDRGTTYIVPRNMVGEVLWSDDLDTIAIFSIESGRLGPHLVRVEAPTELFRKIPRGRGTMPRRRR